MPLKLVNGKLVNSDGETVTNDDVSPIADSASNERRCEECGAELYYSGRGRPPRFCEDHKPVTPNRTRNGATQPRRSSQLRNENALRESLTARYYMLSNIARLRHPAYGDAIRNKIEQAVEADIAYAKVNPSFRRILEGALEKTAAAEVVAVHVSMFAPMIVGEAASRGRKKATPTGRGEASRPSPAPSRANQQPPPQPSAPTTPPEPASENVTRLRRVPDAKFPAEHVGEGDSETTNFDAPDMEGMPGV